jgi:hypothetical protein
MDLLRRRAAVDTAHRPDPIRKGPSPRPVPASSSRSANSATFHEGYCKAEASVRAETAVTTEDSGVDLATDAGNAAENWATFAYRAPSGTPPKITISPAQSTTVTGSAGQLVKATVVMQNHSDPCAPPSAVVYAVAAKAKAKAKAKDGSSVVLVVVADQGTSDSASDADLQKIAGSLRLTA